MTSRAGLEQRCLLQKRSKQVVGRLSCFQGMSRNGRLACLLKISFWEFQFYFLHDNRYITAEYFRYII